jgi:hypothetical protein
MADSDLEALVTAGSEELDVEYKAWMDTSQNEVRAKLARHQPRPSLWRLRRRFPWTRQ